MGRIRAKFARIERRVLGACMRLVALVAERRIARHLDKTVGDLNKKGGKPPARKTGARKP